MRREQWPIALALLACVGCSASVSVDSGPNLEGAGPAPVSRPTLGEIFRDGAYEFEDAPGAERELERAAKRAPGPEPFDEVVAKSVDVEGSPNGMLALAFFLTNEVSAEEDVWEKLVQDAAATGSEPETGTLDGAEVAYVETDVEHSLTIYYARDLVVTVTAPASTPRSELDDIGLYLLDAR